MIAYILLLVYMLANTLSRAVQKWIGGSFPSDAAHLVAFNLLTAPIAIVFLSALAGFRLQLNAATCVYAMIYAVICALSPVLTILAMQSVGVSFAGILGSAGNLITSMLFGVLYYKEPCTLRTILPVIFMLVAVILPTRHLIKPKTNETKNNNSIWLCLAVFLIGGASCIISKLFAMDTRVTDANSYFVFTNVFILLFAGIAWLFLLKKGTPIKNPIKCFPKKQVLSLFGTVALSNVSSLLSVIILASMPVSVYSVLSAALSVIFGLLLSLMFKEKLTKDNYIACALAILAAIVNVWDQLYLLVIS